MIVSPTEPYKLIFSLYQHEHLGYLLEPFVVKLTLKGDLSLQSQNISGANVKDFKGGLSKEQIKLVELTSKIQLDIIYRKFNNNKKLNRDDFFKRIFTSEKKEDELLKETIIAFVDNYKQEIYSRIKSESFFIMGSDGVPTWKEVEVVQENAKVYFHFERGEEKTIYFPILRCGDERIKFQFKGGVIINDKPAILLIDSKLYIFEEHVDGKKLRPFLNKSNIEIPKKIEPTYYKKFIVPLVANFNVFATGFEIVYEKEEFIPQLLISETATISGTGIFQSEKIEAADQVVVELFFDYGDYSFKYDVFSEATYVYLEKTSDSWRFHKVKKNLTEEKAVLSFLKKNGLDLKHGRIVLPKFKVLDWVSNNFESLSTYPIHIKQNQKNSSVYFLGFSNIDLKIAEKNDWFDIEALVVFGEYSIPFKTFRYYILNNIKEFELPNGQKAVIPTEWFQKYSELFENIEFDDELPKLKKQFVGLVNHLETCGIASTAMSRKLQGLAVFEGIEEVKMPKGFVGQLRPYQKAGYDWLSFLEEFGLGGCLADDMGLGKTVTTLAFLQKIKEKKPEHPNLLVLPTSLIYNWQNEAARFTPNLRVLIHFGINRSKDSELFKMYDLVITSYGVLRIDIGFIRYFRFNYAILDESQSIKNASSSNFKAVMDLNTKNRLILTGTPLENSTLDLWSQMSFINPGLLGGLSSFKKKFQNLIEKSKDEEALQQLSAKIKPFMLRRNKRQVAQDLPEKIESIVYVEMTEDQEKIYEETKSFVRNEIMGMKEKGSMKNSSVLILQGLSKLRQLANHPKMVIPDYDGESGKANEIFEKINEVVKDGSKTLIFSQFVKHLKLIAEQLDKEQIPYLYLDGSTRNRIELVNRFQEEDKESIFLISLKAGGVGLNLTAAENVFILDPWWNPAIEAQAIDRAHRIGQKRTVFSYKFITQNTLEEKILELQNRKNKLFEELILEEESFFKSLKTEDILSLLD